MAQASRDVLFLPQGEALDAAEWIKDSGTYLVQELFGVPEEATREELARLIKHSRHLKKLVKRYGL